MKFTGSFGDWLKQRRQALDLTQKELAAQVGCAPVTVRKIEADVARPSKQMAERLADVLAISLEKRSAFLAFARRPQTTLPAIPIESTSTTPAHNLPIQSTAFVGREPELAQIVERLADPRCRLLTLVGPGGIGKTRLALRAAAEVTDFAQGVCFVSLAPVTSASLLASAIAGALQFSFYGPDDPLLQLMTYLSNKHLLLVLDNFEHLMDGTPLLTDLLAHAPHVKLLVTSRECLNLQEEWVFTLDGLSYPVRQTSSDLDGYSAVQLFVQRAKQVQTRFSLAENTESVVRICQVLEGLPLGIEMAASWLRMMSCPEIAEHVQNSLDFLATSLRNVPERHRSIRALLEPSWKLLSEREMRALERLSVFRGGFDLEAAEEVAGAPLSILVALENKSLLRVSSAGRYDLHELIRQFAADKLQQSGEEAAAIRRHLEYFLRIAEQAETLLYSPQQVICHNYLEDNLDNLRMALEQALVGGQAEMALRLAAALEWFWHMRCYWNEGLEWLERGLAAATAAAPALRAKALQRTGDLAFVSWDNHKAIALDEQALALAREIGDRWSIAWSLSNLALARGGNQTPSISYDEAKALFEEALGLFRELGDGWGINHTLARLGITAILAGGDEVTMTTAFEECLTLARAAEVKSAIAWMLRMWGDVIFLRSHDLARVVALYEESLQLFREARVKEGIWMTLSHLGEALYLQEDYARARIIQEEGMMLSVTKEYIFPITTSLRLQARMARSLGNYEQALTTLAECLALDRDRGNKRGVAFSLALLGSIALEQRKPAHAATLFGVARQQFAPSSMALNPLNRDTLVQFKQDLAAARTQLGESAFVAALAEGQAMTMEQVVAYALQQPDDSAL